MERWYQLTSKIQQQLVQMMNQWGDILRRFQNARRGKRSQRSGMSVRGSIVQPIPFLDLLLPVSQTVFERGVWSELIVRPRYEQEGEAKGTWYQH